MENAPVLAGGQSMWGMFAWIAVLLAFMYFMMIRPNKKRMEEYKRMLSSLAVGNRIVFAGGIYGTVRSISGDSVKVEIADGVVIEVPKSAIGNIV